MTVPAANPTKEKRHVSPLRRYSLFLWLGGALVVFTVIAAAVLFRTGIRAPFTGATFTVVKKKLQVTIVERGALEAGENSDIICQVKAKSAGSTIASTIKWVIDDGAQVKAGDRIMDLDDSGFQEQLKTQKNTVNKAKADWVEADTNCTFQQIENESNIKTAEVNLIQKKLELRKYVGEVAASKMLKMQAGAEMLAYIKADFEKDVQKESALSGDKLTSGYLQDVGIFEGAIENSRSDKESWLDRAMWSQRMVKKNLYTASQAEADQSKLNSAEIALKKVLGDLDIYRNFELEKNVTVRWNDVKEAERGVTKVKIQADSKMKKAVADEESKRAILNQELDRQRDMENEEKNYKITAPQDGMIVYYMETSRQGIGTQQAIVAQGEPVREGQKMIRIPNLRKMMVNTRVHEAMVSKVKGEKTKPTGFGDAVWISSSLGRLDNLGLAGYYYAFKDLREGFKEYEQQLTRRGQSATIRVDAHPDRQYKGSVKSVATVASAAEFFSSDVKVYQTMVSIEDATKEDQLKPGMSAEVTILADETKDEVLVIPIQSVVGNVAMGSKRKCFVIDGRGYPQEREIEIGKSNDKLVEVRSGLDEGDKVAMNPRPLLPEKSDLKPGTPGTRRGGDFEEDPASKKSMKKKDGGGNFKGTKGGGGPPSGELQPPERTIQDPGDRAPRNKKNA